MIPGDEVRDLDGKSEEVRQNAPVPAASLRRTTIPVFHSKRRPVECVTIVCISS